MYRLSLLAALILVCLIIAPSASAQNEPRAPSGPEAQKCAALVHLSLENVPGGPALITSARLVDVPASGLEQWPITAGGFGKWALQS